MDARGLRRHQPARGWRADLLEALAAPRQPSLDHPPTMEFRDYCVEELSRRQSTADPVLSSLHSDGQGWLWFRHPKDLAFKASSHDRSLRPTERVSRKLGRARNVAPRGRPARRLLHYDGHVEERGSPARLPEAAGVPQPNDDLDQALDACRRITDWFDNGGAELLSGGGDASWVPPEA